MGSRGKFSKHDERPTSTDASRVGSKLKNFGLNPAAVMPEAYIF